MPFGSTMFGQMAPVFADRARTSLERELSYELAKDAVTAGWPREIVALLRVEYGEDGFEVTNEDHPAVMDFEYGTQDAPPSPVIREFKRRMPQIADDTLSEMISDTIGEIL